MLTRSLQPENAVLLIEVTPAGSVMLTRLSQPWNKSSSKEVSPAQFSSDSDTLLLALSIPSIMESRASVSAASMTVPDGSAPIISVTTDEAISPENVTDSRFEQSVKTPVPTEVTVSGIAMFSSPVHPLNALLPIEVTVEGIVTLVLPSGQQIRVVPLLLRRTPLADE